MASMSEPSWFDWTILQRDVEIAREGLEPGVECP